MVLVRTPVLAARSAGLRSLRMFRALFRRKNVRRALGPKGELKKVPRPGGFYVYMREDWGSLWPFPVSMKIAWDD